MPRGKETIESDAAHFVLGRAAGGWAPFINIGAP
jgi:hypothetical protein